MNALLPFVILGITAGSVYGLTGTGLVLTYKTSGIFNFAQGAVATTGAYVFYILHDDVLHLPAVPTALICVFVVGPVLGLGMEAMARRLADASATMKVVATIGLVLVVQGFFSATFGTLARTFPAWLPQHTVKVGGVFVGEDQMIITGIALAATMALFLFFRLTRLGLAMRGVVDNPELLDLGGTSPAAVRRWAWIIGSSFAVLAGVLLAPTLNLDATVLTLLVVQAFGAAAIGRFSSLPLTYIGGLVIGIVASVATKYVVTGSAALAGLPGQHPVHRALPGADLYATVQAGQSAGLPAPPGGRICGARPGCRSRAPSSLGAVLLIVPHLVNSAQLPYWSDGMTQVILFLSLGLLVRTSGQVSLCQAAFAAIGATTMGHLTAGFGLALGGRAAAGGPGGGADRRLHRDPRHPPARGLPGPGHVRLRRHDAADGLSALAHVRLQLAGPGGEPALVRPGRHRLLLPGARLRGARQPDGHVAGAQQARPAARRAWPTRRSPWPRTGRAWW